MSKQTRECTVEGLIKHLGPDDPIILNTIFNLAQMYLHLGDYKKSHELLLLVVKKQKRLFGPDYTNMLIARNKLGISCCAQGRMDVAKRLVTNMLESCKKILGKELVYTL